MLVNTAGLFQVSLSMVTIEQGRIHNLVALLIKKKKNAPQIIRNFATLICFSVFLQLQ